MHTRSGSALVITLGLLAVLGLLVFGYVYSARTERFAARHARDRVSARQYVDLALSAAMRDTDQFTSIQGSPARFDYWHYSAERFGYADPSRSYPGYTRAFSKNVFFSIDTNAAPQIDEALFHSAATNLIPASLREEANGLQPHWLPIEGVNEATGNRTGTNGFIAYAVFNCSGLLDANFATSNQLAWLASQEDPDITVLDLFLQDRARATATNGLVTQYLDLHDLRLRSRGLAEQPRNLFTWSYDPGPDVTVTNGDVYSNRDVQLVLKWDVNCWTNKWDGRFDLFDLSDWSDLSDLSDDLSEHYRSEPFRSTWLPEVTNRLATIGFANPQALAWNLVNFMDPDRIPQGPDGHIAWQEPWPVEDVPLINEVAVGMVPLEDDYFDDGIAKPNHYAPGVELWYPFATNRITEADEAQLIVAVYTNWVPEHYAHDPYWTNNVIEPRPKHGVVFTNDIEHMQFGTITEFVTATLPPPYISFPVTVTNAIPQQKAADDFCYKPLVGSNPDRLVPFSYSGGTDLDPPPLFELSGETRFLPLGIASYYTYLPDPDDPAILARTQLTVTNTIHLLARVKLGEHWVDEAAGYHPGGGGREARTNLLVFTEPCGYEVNDPRRNGYREDWHRYLPADRAAPAWDPEKGAQPVCSLNGATNLITNPWHIPYGQGLPLVHFNRMLDRAGDIGYIQQPYPNPGHPDTSSNSNLWQSICLASTNVLASNAAGFSFTAGSVLEFFTARATNNTPVRGLVHFSTTHTNVIRALMADLTIGWDADPAYLNPTGIKWMQEAFVAAQDALYAVRYENGQAQYSIPVGVGDLCSGLGKVQQFTDISATYLDEAEDAWRLQHSLGNDLKEDILRGLAERVSFRQHVFVICLAGKTVAPSGRTTALQRAVAIVLRDAYTGRWQVVSWQWL